MRREELQFARPTELFASAPPERRHGQRDAVRLLVSGRDSERHARFRELPEYLRRGDLLVVNNSATIAASLPTESRLGPILLNFSTRFTSQLWLAEPRWSAARPGPLPLREGEELRTGGGRLRLVAAYPGIPRLWFVRGDRPIADELRSSAGPIHYGYAPAYPLDVYQTLFSTAPGSSEMPSAARPFTPELCARLRDAGVGLSSVTLHTGVSSLEIESSEVEQQALYPEPFEVSAATARAVNATRARGGRIVAVGTTVVRALESAWTRSGLRASRGFTRLFVHPAVGVRAVDGLLTGLHDPFTSHLALLAAIGGLDRVRRAYEVAIRARYRWHEFGDSHLLWGAHAGG